MRKKLLRFKDNKEASNVIEPGKAIYKTIKGHWDVHFGNGNPLNVELGCGRATYTVALAERLGAINFIGIDIKGSRLWAGSQAAMEKGLSNVALVRSDIRRLEDFFRKEEIANIYLPFPDPRPRDKDEKKRLTSPYFLGLYKKLLSKGGALYFKSDNQALFDYTRHMLVKHGFKLLMVTENIHKTLPDDHLLCAVKTPYEKRFLAEGLTIKYIHATL